jgi:hypothetical protein
MADIETVKKNAISAEQARVADIMTLSTIAGSATIIAAALKDATATKASVALQLVEAQQAAATKVGAATSADMSDLATQIAAVDSNAPQTTDAAKEIALGKAIAASFGDVK